MREIRPDYEQQFLLPPCIEDWVPPEHEVRFVRTLVQSLDLKGLGFKQRPAGPGAPYYAADTLLSVWLYGYMLKIRSSRQLETACRNQMPFIWLTGNRCPDHNTLWRFFAENKEPMGNLFKQTARLAVSLDMVGFVLQAVDGTRIQAAVSTSRALHSDDLEVLLKEWDASAHEAVQAIETNHSHEAKPSRLPKRLREPDALRRQMAKALTALNPRPHKPEPPSGEPEPGETKAQVEQALDKMREQGVKHLHPHDADARVMKCKDRNRRLPGYNAQVMVDEKHQVIVGETVVQTASDKRQLVPMLEQTEQAVGRAADETLADSGYARAEQFHHADPRPVLVNLTETILPQPPKPLHKSQFTYDPGQDVYTCPLTATQLAYEGTRRHREKKQQFRIYRCRNRQCPHRGECTRERHGRIIEQSQYQTAVDLQIRRQQDPDKKSLLRQRGRIVEPVFGRIKRNFEFRRFTVYGLDASRAQWSLICAAYNAKKIIKHLQERWKTANKTAINQIRAIPNAISLLQKLKMRLSQQMQ